MCSNNKSQIPNPKSQKKRGFSLVEIMVVVVIIGLLAGAVSLGVKAYVDKARVNRAKFDISNIASAIEAYYAVHSEYPNEDEAFKVLVKEKLLEKSPTDPWSRPYEYELVGKSFKITCYGRDGREGGTGIDADVTSDDLETKKEK